MGAKAKVDAKLYAKIKKELKTPKDDTKVMKKYKLGQTTVRAIRRSNSYKMFKLKTSMRKPKVKKELSPQEQAGIAWTGFMLIAFILAFAVLVLFFRWVLSWFGI